MIEWFAVGLILVGAALALLAAVGLHRFDNVIARMHAATKPATLGLMMIVIGAAIRLGNPGDAAKLMLVLVFQFLTAPITAQLVSRAAYRSVVDVTASITVDELAEYAAEDGLGSQDGQSSP